MSTEQSYVGRGSYATQPPQTAKTGPHSPSSPDDWRKAFLQKVASNEEALSSLFDLLYLAWDFRDSRSSEGFQAELFSVWIDKKNEDLNQYRIEIRDFVTQLNYVNRLKEEFEFFNINSGYTNAFQSKKGVSHD